MRQYSSINMQNLSRQDKIYSMAGIMLALFLGALDQTIVAAAAPKIVADLQGLERYDWVATSYLLASTALVPIYGKLADTYSRKTIELCAVIIFLTGSVLCGLSGEFGTLPILGDGMNQLILFRALQGLGGAGLFGLAFIIIADLFPPSERGKYQGFMAATFGVASVLGPLAGGFLTDHGGTLVSGIAGWRWVFYVNLPFGAIALWFIIAKMPALLPSGDKKRLDYFSAFLLIAGLVPLVLALRLDKSTGALLPLLVIGGALALAGFVWRSLRAANPMLDLGLFRSRLFVTCNIALFLFGAAFMGILVFLPLFMVNVLGVSATSAGISLIPLSLGLVFGSIASGQLVSRFGHYRRLMLGGGVLLFVGVLLLSRMTIETQFWHIVFYMVLCGLGLGPSFPLYTLAIQNEVEPARVGQATSASQFFRQIGGAIGVALMGALLIAHLGEGVSLDAIAGASSSAPSKAAFASGITQLYFYELFLVVAAWIATWFVPELPLRQSHDFAPAVEM